MESVLKVIVLGALAAVFAVLVSVLYALPVMLIWNALMPELFKLPELSFLQALLLSALCGLLFKSSSSSSSS